MRILAGKGEIEDVIIAHEGTNCKYHRIIWNHGCYEHKEHPKEGNTAVIRIKDMEELSGMIEILLDFRKMILDEMGIWETKMLNNRGVLEYKTKIKKQREW